jgi:hypothetical protein
VCACGQGDQARFGHSAVQTVVIHYTLIADVQPAAVV